MRVRFAAGVALVGVALMAAGCTRTLDKSGLETQLATALSSSGPALTVDCPDGVKAEAGATFQCTAKDPSGSTVSINVTQTDDKGNVTWTVAGASASPTASSSISPSSLPTPTSS